MGITQFFEKGFYEQDASRNPAIGSVWWAPVPESREVPIILDVTRAAPDEHGIVDFSFVDAGSQHFKSKSRLPIKRLNLDDTQELMVSKGKKRPCVVLGKATVSNEDIASLTDADKEQGRQAKHLCKPMYLLAPMYGCATYHERGGFGPILTARVKALQYPHLCYFPPLKHAEVKSNPGSIMRLDHAFPSFLGKGCEPDGQRVLDCVMEVVLDQFMAVCGMEPSDNFVAIKELIQTCLPDDLR